MLKCLRFSLLILLLILFQSNDLISRKVIGDSIKSLPDTIADWQLKGKPEIYRGDDLFLYINGGADIYHEYGFVEVISSEYEKPGAGRISVEIYRMKDPESAFGIFTFRTGGKWQRSSRGSLFSSEDYYLNILLGENLVTITSIDINEETGKGIELFRSNLEAVSAPSLSLPDIINCINPDRYKSRIYFKGDMGLKNIYNLFSSESEIAQGVSGTNKDGIIIILEFTKGDDPFKRLKRFGEHFRGEKRYSDFVAEGKTIHFSDRGKRKLLITEINGRIIVSIQKTLCGCKESIRGITPCSTSPK